MRSPPPEEEGAPERVCDELTTTLIPCLPVPLGGKEVEKLGVKLRLGRRERWVKGVFKVRFHF